LKLKFSGRWSMKNSLRHKIIYLLNFLNGTPPTSGPEFKSRFFLIWCFITICQFYNLASSYRTISLKGVNLGVLIFFWYKEVSCTTSEDNSQYTKNSRCIVVSITRGWSMKSEMGTRLSRPQLWCYKLALK
jgi:hypothetical protein